MHSRIFQLGTKEFDEFDIITGDEDSILDSPLVDYADALEADDKEDTLKWLVESSNGMLSLTEDGNLIYNGGVEKIIENHLRRLREFVSQLSVDNYQMWRVKEIASKPLDEDYLFVIGDRYNEPELSSEFVGLLSRLSEGDKIYVGGVLDYHF